MQIIKHTQGCENIHNLMNDIDTFYSQVSDIKQSKSGLFNTHKVYDDSFKELADLFHYHSNIDIDIPNEFEHKDIDKLSLPSYNTKNIIVCFSGGKDSFSVAKHYQNMGYNVYLYHLVGLNFAYCGYASELEFAQQSADYLGLPLIVEKITYNGYHKWVEHPMKNMILVNSALSYGIRHNIGTKIAVGSFNTSYLMDNPFEVCGGDCEEMWVAYEHIIQRIIPKFTIYRPNINYQTSYNAILKDPDALQYTISCMTSNKYRKQFRERTMSKYAINLLPKRCGCCWKCALEYIWFCDHNKIEYDRDYYIHCIEILAHTIELEDNEVVSDVEQVWSKYLFYPMTKSKAYKEISNAIISSKKVKIRN